MTTDADAPFDVEAVLRKWGFVARVWPAGKDLSLDSAIQWVGVLDGVVTSVKLWNARFFAHLLLMRN